MLKGGWREEADLRGNKSRPPLPRKGGRIIAINANEVNPLPYPEDLTYLINRLFYFYFFAFSS